MLFDKKSPIDKLFETYSKLPEEDKAKFKAKLEDIDKAEDEREIDEIEEEKADTPEVADEKKEETEEETEEIAKEVDEAEEEEPAETEEEEVAEEPAETDQEEVPEEIDQEVKEIPQGDSDVIKGLIARIEALEEMIISDKEEKVEDAGISGMGKTSGKNVEEDNRDKDLIKSLGGMA